MKNLVKKISFAALSFAAVGFTSAQKVDAKSKSLLDAVAKNYSDNTNTYFKFSYGTGANGKVSKTETGIFYSTPSQYKLKIMGTEQIFDGKKVYNISAEDQEVTVAKADGNSMMFSPTNYLTSYKKDFNTSYVGKKLVNGVNAEMIKLTPVKNNGLKNVYIFLNPTTKQIVKIEQYSANNDVAVIAVKEYKENQKLNSSMFTFDKNQYKNYVVTEL